MDQDSQVTRLNMIILRLPAELFHSIQKYLFNKDEIPENLTYSSDIDKFRHHESRRCWRSFLSTCRLVRQELRKRWMWFTLNRESATQYVNEIDFQNLLNSRMENKNDQLFIDFEKIAFDQLAFNFSQMHTIIISHNNSIVRLPKISSVKYVKITFCSDLFEIDSLENINKIFLSNCPSFKKIGTIKNLKTIYLGKLPELLLTPENLAEIQNIDYYLTNPNSNSSPSPSLLPPTEKITQLTTILAIPFDNFNRLTHLTIGLLPYSRIILPSLQIPTLEVLTLSHVYLEDISNLSKLRALLLHEGALIGNGKNELFQRLNYILAFEDFFAKDISWSREGYRDGEIVRLQSYHQHGHYYQMNVFQGVRYFHWRRKRVLHHVQRLVIQRNACEIQGLCPNFSPISSSSSSKELELSSLSSSSSLSPPSSKYCYELIDICYTDISILPKDFQFLYIQQLDLSYCRLLSDISIFQNCDPIPYLILRGCIQIKDFSPLYHWTIIPEGYSNDDSCSSYYQLRYLDVSENPGITHDDLFHFKNISSLNISNCSEISDLSMLTGNSFLIANGLQLFRQHHHDNEVLLCEKDCFYVSLKQQQQRKQHQQQMNDQDRKKRVEKHEQSSSSVLTVRVPDGCHIYRFQYSETNNNEDQIMMVIDEESRRNISILEVSTN